MNPSELEAEGDRLLEFARGSVHPEGGFAWLDDAGRPELDRPVELWITCRMTHVFALAHLMGRPWAAELVDHGVAALTGRFRDAVHGGWYAAIGPDGPVTTDKTAYEHAFVVLAASSAVVAQRPGAQALLAQALDVFDRRFWDDDAGMAVEQWDETFAVLDPYRGVNANMHTVEALLAAADVTGVPVLRERALRITTRVVHDLARGNDWRIPEHFDPSWTPLLDYNRDEPAHPFRPYGATIGHWLEWSRLALDLRAALGDDAPAWLLDDARALFGAAVREGWAVDGAAGFVYTVGWDGRPVVRQRMHWVLAEAVAAAATLAQVTGDPAYAICAEQWWAHAATHLIDTVGGSWHHELDPQNRPDARTWAGKPDVYHAFQATLFPRLPGDSVHITSDEVLTWNQVYELIAAAAGVADPRLVPVTSERIAAAEPALSAPIIGDKAHSMVLDNSKVKGLVPGWRATVPFAVGARQIVDWYDADPARQVLDPDHDRLSDLLTQG